MSIKFYPWCLITNLWVQSVAATRSWYFVELDRIRVLRIRESGSLANFDSWRPKTPGLLAKRPSKRPEKDPKNRFTGPDFENTESNRGSRVLILRIRSSSNWDVKWFFDLLDVYTESIDTNDMYRVRWLVVAELILHYSPYCGGEIFF